MKIIDRYNFKTPDKLTQPLKNNVKIPFPAVKRDTDQKHVFILAIGNNSKLAERPLEYAEKDAYDLVATLHDTHPKGYVHSMTLTGPQANVESIRAAFKWLQESTKPQDDVQIMFSGHGIIDFRTQHYFYLSYDPQGRLTDENLISDVWMSNLVGSVSGNVNLYLDTCFSNNFNDYLMVHKPVTQSDFLTSFTSSASWTLSYESWSYKNGFFSEALIQGLGGAADRNQDGRITDLELAAYVNKMTPLLSKGRQKSSTFFHTNFDLFK